MSVRYLNLDRFFRAVAGLVAYRIAVTRCFFSGPRLGHEWEGGGLLADCKRCPKHWIGNL